VEEVAEEEVPVTVKSEKKKKRKSVQE